MAGKLIRTGRIGAPFAVQGWLKVNSFTHPPENLADYRPWLLGREGHWQEHNPVEVKVSSGGIVARFEGISSREDARALVNLWIACPEDSLPGLATDEVYWHQLIGLRVVNADDVVMGQVHNMMDTGAQPVMVVAAGTSGSSKQDQEILIPWVPEQYVLDVDLEQGRILVDWQADW